MNSASAAASCRPAPVSCGSQRCWRKPSHASAAPSSSAASWAEMKGWVSQIRPCITAIFLMITEWPAIAIATSFCLSRKRLHSCRIDSATAP